MPRKKKATSELYSSGVKNSKSFQIPGTSNVIVASSSKTVKNVATSEKILLDEDSFNLLSVFPEEIWLLILRKVKHTQDVAILSNSSLFFRNFLLPNRVSFLFPQVWKVLGMKYEREKNTVYQEDEQSVTLKQSRANSGNLCKITSYSVILKLRQVCRTWCDGVDQFYKNLDYHFRMQQDATQSKMRVCKWHFKCVTVYEYWSINEGFKKEEWISCWGEGCWSRRYVLYHLLELNKFNTHFEQTHQNQESRSPFLSNKVCFKVIASQEHMHNLETFLMNYSKHIWYCDMIVDESETKLSELYTKLRRILELLPNLVGLEINFPPYSPEYVQSREFPELDRNILKNPLPTLVKLRYLKTENLPSKWFNQLIIQNRHIEMLETQREELIEDWSFYLDEGEVPPSHPSVYMPTLERHSLFSAQMPNLTKMSLDICSESEFQKLRNVSWNLETLYLNFCTCSYIPWSQIFQLVEQKWNQTVSEVMIGLPSSKTPAEIQQHIQEHDSLRLKLPKIKRLKVELGNYSSIDFILPMKDLLKQVDITEAYLDHEAELQEMWELTGFQQTVKQNSVIKYLDQKDKYDASIWKMLPKLEVTEYFKGTLNASPYPDTYKRSGWLRAQTVKNNTVE